MAHLLQPTDELRRQFEAGEISREFYEAWRATLPEPAGRLCETPRCTRPAHVIQRGRALCAVCGLVERSKRR